MFSEGITNRGDCIGAAKSNNGLNFVPINTWTFCSPTQSTGFLDPSLFVDPAGRVWLLFSQQWAPNGGSAIDAVQIDALGIFDGSENCPFPAGDCGIVGESAGRWSAYTLLSYGSVANINANPGSSSFLEGPSMTTDDYNGFDLTFSWEPGPAIRHMTPANYRVDLPQAVVCHPAMGELFLVEAALQRRAMDPPTAMS